MQNPEEEGHETEAVRYTGGADGLRTESKNGRQNKQADGQHVNLIPAVTPILLLFLQKFLPKGNPCELFVCFYLWGGTKLDRYQDIWKLSSLYIGTLKRERNIKISPYGSLKYHFWIMKSLFDEGYMLLIIIYDYFYAKVEILIWLHLTHCRVLIKSDVNKCMILIFN